MMISVSGMPVHWEPGPSRVGAVAAALSRLPVGAELAESSSDGRRVSRSPVIDYVSGYVLSIVPWVHMPPIRT
jgi:uncharacterized repeat protein (TIGR03917 family)